MESKKDREELENWKRKKEQKEIEKYGATLEEISKYDIKELNKISKILKKILITVWIIAILLFMVLIFITLRFIAKTFGTVSI